MLYNVLFLKVFSIQLPFKYTYGFSTKLIIGLNIPKIVAEKWQFPYGLLLRKRELQLQLSCLILSVIWAVYVKT